MTIKEDLPLEQCQDCKNFLMHCEKKQVIFDATGGMSELVLTVSCKRESRCEVVKEWAK